MADVLDILDFERESRDATDETNDNKKSRKRRTTDATFKRPEGMHRELYALLYSDKKDNPSLMPTDFTFQSKSQGYKQIKAKLGLKKPRPWHWTKFLNPGRKDSFQLFHWRRIADEGKEYPFAKFNAELKIPTYNDMEYHQHLQTDGWNKAETDHLFDLCRRFDERFVIIHDRWDRTTFTTPRTMECLKDRYYNVWNILTKLRTPSGHEVKLRIYDAEHERKRKEQLIKLYDRTPEQVEEEQNLLSELRKIEMRKKEREKKTQDLQKLITAADNSAEARKAEQRSGARPGRKKTSQMSRSQRESLNVSQLTPNLETAGIKFPEIKASGASLRSQRMKLPASIGQKKMKAIEQLLQELNIELHPMPTEDICQHFNELRSDMVLLYELKMALANCEYEMQSCKHQYEASQPGKSIDIPATLLHSNGTLSKGDAQHNSFKISEVIDIGSGVGTPNRKRRSAAIEQSNMMKKLKKN